MTVISLHVSFIQLGLIHHLYFIPITMDTTAKIGNKINIQIPIHISRL